jgi:tetratricopeptide (TPR) repeat protein
MNSFGFLKLTSVILTVWLLSLLLNLSPLPVLASLQGEASSHRLTASPLAQSPVTPTEAMSLANQNYEAGDYAEAAAIYEAIIESGLHNSTVYYNLGNAYYKQGELGRAILNYRRAQRLAPRDTDVTANLAVARTQTVDQLELPAQGAWSNLAKLVEEWLTLPEATLLALVLWELIAGVVIGAILKPSIRRWGAITVGGLAVFMVIGLLSIANRYYTDETYPAAVIVAQQIDVTSGPGGTDQYLVEFTLHAGAEVSVLESRPGWQRITLPGDLQGWVPDKAVEQVGG